MVKTSPSSGGGEGSIPGWGAKIPHALWPKNQNIKQKQYCNKFDKVFKNSRHQKKSFKTNHINQKQMKHNKVHTLKKSMGSGHIPAYHLLIAV